MPKDEIVNYSLVPFFLLTTLAGRFFSFGKVCNDPETSSLLNVDATSVTEVAGPAAYIASGFTKAT
jgi:hypothetical protein